MNYFPYILLIKVKSRSDNNLNRLISPSRNRRSQSLGPACFIADLYQGSQVQLLKILLKLFYKIQKERTLSNSFYEVMVTLIHKTYKDSIKKCFVRKISFMNIDEKLSLKYLLDKSKNTSTTKRLGFIPDILRINTSTTRTNGKNKPHDHLTRTAKYLTLSKILS